MTIYDSDYTAVEAMQAEYSTPGVIEPAAEVQEASIPQNDPLEQVAQVSQESDKDYNFKALREELAQIKEDRDRLRGDFEDLRRSNVQRQPEQAFRKSAIDDINSDDLVTGAQFKQILAEREAEYQLMLGELHVKSQNQDYDEVTSKYGIPLIEKEPDLQSGFMNANAANKAAYLYKIGKMAQDQQAYRELIANQSQPTQYVQPEPRVSKSAERIVANASKPGTLSAPTGGAGNLSKADYYATMSEAEFTAMINRNLEQI